MKVLINVHVPAISEKYDIWVPDNLRIKSAASLIAKAVEELSNHMYVVTGEECLCSAEKNVLLRQNVTLEGYGIGNGDHLIMM